MLGLIFFILLSMCKNRNYALDVSSAASKASSKVTLTRGTVNDIVSRNITMVLENLLMNYENNQLPTHGKGTPTVVKTNILIRSMGPVSELDMDYSMDCYFRQSWRDSRLSFLGPIKSLSLSIKMLERIWRPDTYFYNGKHSYVHTITVPNKLLRISQDGDILYSMRLTIKAKCPMELRNFPMDRQSCPLILGSYSYESVSYERGSMTVSVASKPSTMERQTQTEVWIPKWRQFLYCLAGDESFRKRRQREAAGNCRKRGEKIARHINSVSYIDKVARIVFPASFGLLNVCYWVIYVTYQEEFKWQDPPLGSISQ
ncbi:gamma-aminobutyric acid receptor subunit alpha-5-like [Apis florea]|uniref:gamma-aminobutyric acid receptor subunit alpha-5-like n=1 Tax=Apis florea TaxID=7463 RepID=UPI0006298DED|nr:gamma-aminobutyric acid receptor subunit alpha-5-like [Apis florea]